MPIVAHRDIRHAEFPDERQWVVACDSEDRLGGEARLQVLPNSRNEEPHPAGPEREPSPDQQHQRQSAVQNGLIRMTEPSGRIAVNSKTLTKYMRPLPGCAAK